MSTTERTNESSDDTWVQVSNLVGTILASVGFGVMFTLYAQSLAEFTTHFKRKEHQRRALFYTVYTTVMVVLLCAGLASNVQISRAIWIDNRNYPGGPYAFITEETNLPVFVWSWTIYMITGWLQDTFVVYRVLVHYNWDMKFAGFLVLCFVGSFATSLGLIIEMKREGLTGPASVTLASCYYIITVTLNILATTLILVRLLWNRRQISTVLGKEHCKKYAGVVAILVESSALYTVFCIIFIATYFKQNPVTNLVIPVLGVLQGISPMMIIYRLSIGKGWTTETAQRISPKLPTIRFTRFGVKEERETEVIKMDVGVEKPASALISHPSNGFSCLDMPALVKDEF